MLRVLTIILLVLQPLAASALCSGSDMIAALPASDRAALNIEAQAAPYPEGLLWQARKGESEIVIFGTYHFPHEQTSTHLERLKPLIDRAGVVYLEVSNEDQRQLQSEIATDPSIMFITEGKTLPDLLGEEDWQTLSDEMRARAIPSFMAAKFKPIWAAMMLGIGPCEARNGVMEQHGIDARIGEYAAGIGKPSQSLEDYRALLGVLDGFPLEEQLDMIRLFFAWSGNADDMAYTLRHYYLQQKVALIWAYSRKISLEFGGERAEQDLARFEEAMLTRRNQGWIEVLTGNTAGQSVFMAVGAAHLPGENGVLRLLENQGFEIRQLPF